MVSALAKPTLYFVVLRDGCLYDPVLRLSVDAGGRGSSSLFSILRSLLTSRFFEDRIYLVRKEIMECVSPWEVDTRFC